MIRLRDGVGLTLWDSTGHADPRHYLVDPEVRSLLALARPEIVQVHGGPGALTRHGAEVTVRLGAILPGVRVWWGAAMDWAPRERDRRAVVASCVALAQAAAGAGVELLVWNAEGAWKAPGTDDDKLAREIVSRVRAACPALAQGLTSFDRPTVHSEYCWTAWCGPGGVDVMLPQVYAGAGVPNGELAGRGALARRLAASMASLDKAERLRMIRPGMQRVVYAQAHHVPASQTATELLDVPLACLWAAPARIDDDGRLALLALCEARRRGYGGRPGEAERLVRDLGAASRPGDRVVGLKALRALGVQ